jgi:hypothetical protein
MKKRMLITVHNDIEKDSSFKHLEIDKSTKGHEMFTDELTELLNICCQKKLRTVEEFLGTG